MAVENDQETPVSSLEYRSTRSERSRLIELWPAISPDYFTAISDSDSRLICRYMNDVYPPVDTSVAYHEHPRFSFFNPTQRSGSYLCSREFKTLRGSAFIHAAVVDNFMLAKKSSGEWGDHIDFFPTTLTNFILGDRWQSNQGAAFTGYNINLSFSGKVFLPYCLSRHWCVFVLDVKQQTIMHLDPLGSNNSDRSKIFLDYLNKYEEMNPGNRNNLPKIAWKITSDIPVLPIQHDGFNCGSLIMHYMDIFARTEQGVSNSAFAPNEFRIEVAHFLLATSSSLEDICLGCCRKFTPRHPFQYTCHCCARSVHEDCLDTVFRNAQACKFCPYVEERSSSTGIIGLPNPPGFNNCWLNASVQALFEMEVFEEIGSPFQSGYEFLRNLKILKQTAQANSLCQKATFERLGNILQ